MVIIFAFYDVLSATWEREYHHSLRLTGEEGPNKLRLSAKAMDDSCTKLTENERKRRGGEKILLKTRALMLLAVLV